LGLIKKTTLEKKKPGFEWVGLEGINSFLEKIKTEGIKFDDDVDLTKNPENSDSQSESESDHDSSCKPEVKKEHQGACKPPKIKKKNDTINKTLLETDVKKPINTENRNKTVKKAALGEKEKFSSLFQTLNDKNLMMSSLSYLMGIRPFPLSQSTLPSDSEVDNQRSSQMEIEKLDRVSRPSTFTKETLTIIVNNLKDIKLTVYYN
jgi:hypothetical protein